MCVVRARGRLGVELYAQHRFVFQTDALQRVIVQAFISDFYFLGVEIALRYAIIMILDFFI